MTSVVPPSSAAAALPPQGPLWRSVFISCATGELAEVRRTLYQDLSQADLDVAIQEHLHQSVEPTLAKLSEYIFNASVVVHVVGRSSGAVPSEEDRQSYYSDRFLARHPDLQRDVRDSVETISYSQWEALIAIHARTPLLVYRLDGGDSSQSSSASESDRVQRHLALLARGQRFPSVAHSLGELRTLVLRDVAKRLKDERWSEAVKRTLATPRLGQEEDENPYVWRRLDDEIDAFLRGPRAAMIVVGQSGMGKTTTLSNVLARYREIGDLCYGANSRDMTDRDRKKPGDAIVKDLTGKDPQELQSKDFFAQLDRESAQQTSTRIALIVIDAVNEYEVSEQHQFIVDLHEMVQEFAELPNRRLKLLITMRPETWMTRPELIRRPESKALYHLNQTADRAPEIAHTLSRFDDAEAAAAYAAYTKAYGIATDLTSLSPMSRHHLSDPLLLRLTCDVYRHRAIPGELDMADVFARYKDDHERIGDRDRGVIESIVSDMFCSTTGDRGGYVIQRDAIGLSDLEKRDPTLFEKLNPPNDTETFFDMPARKLPGYRLRELRVLRYNQRTYRFFYDRFAEYLLSEELFNRIRYDKPGTKLDSKVLWPRALKVLCANLKESKNVVTLFRVLRRTLQLLFEEGGNYLHLLRQIARSGERGLSLVVSTLGSLAMQKVGDRDGLLTLEKVFGEFKAEEVSIWGRFRRRSRASFPLVDSSHRLLLDEEYRAYRAGLPDKRRGEHERFLQENLEWALSSPRRDISAPAIQYIHFLWRDEAAYPHAVAMTRRLLERVRPMTMAYVFFRRRRALLENLVALFVLTLGEAKTEAQRSRIIPFTRELVQRVNLDRSRAIRRMVGTVPRQTTKLRFGRRMARAAQAFAEYVITDLLGKLPNPINLASLYDIFADREIGADARSTMDVLEGATMGRTVDAATVKRLVTSQNAYIIEMLTFALSVGYENVSHESANASYLEVIKDILNDAQLPGQAQYCAALALYHINYFGSHFTAETVGLMGDAARAILTQRKGIFTLLERKREKSHNFNIVGTYGRVLSRERLSPLGFIGESLDEAKRAGDLVYYLYVCENVGLLGVLIAPAPVLEILGAILSDLKAKSASAFLLKNQDEIRRVIVASLANIRVLHRQEVDRFVLDYLDDPSLHADVVAERPKFNFGTFYSWASEQLIFRMFTNYLDEIGIEFIAAIRAALAEKEAFSGIRAALRIVFDRLNRLVQGAS